MNSLTCVIYGVYGRISEHSLRERATSHPPPCPLPACPSSLALAFTPSDRSVEPLSAATLAALSPAALAQLRAATRDAGRNRTRMIFSSKCEPMKPATPMKTPMMRMQSWIQLIFGGARTLSSDQKHSQTLNNLFLRKKTKAQACENAKAHLAHRSTLSTLYFSRRLFNSALSSAKIPCTSSKFTFAQEF